MATTESDQMAYIAAQAADARVNVEVETDEGMTLNLGPQHPANTGKSGRDAAAGQSP